MRHTLGAGQDSIVLKVPADSSQGQEEFPRDSPTASAPSPVSLALRLHQEIN